MLLVEALELQMLTFRWPLERAYGNFNKKSCWIHFFPQIFMLCFISMYISGYTLCKLQPCFYMRNYVMCFAFTLASAAACVSWWFSARRRSWLFSHHMFLCTHSIRWCEFHIYKIFEHCLLLNISLEWGSVFGFPEFAVRNTIWSLKSIRKPEILWWLGLDGDWLTVLLKAEEWI